MKWSQAHIFTLKEAPQDAEVKSHQLMVRAGLIKKIGPGLYVYGNLALRAIRKFENIIRSELNSRSCTEVLMPMVQPRELWEETGRWTEMGAGLLKFQNRNQHWFCLGATHEEVVTDYVRHDLKSYRDFPRNIYQIQTKYRDEIRPRFGLMRGREFIMKDAYSFDLDSAAALKSYDDMYKAYQAIFDRLGVTYRIVQADAGNIGGSQTHEFQLLAEAGEDHLLVSDSSSFAANIEICPALTEIKTQAISASTPVLEKFATPGLKQIKTLAQALKVPESELVKTLFFSEDEALKPFAVLLRGNDEANLIKIKNALGLANPPRMLTDDEVKAASGAYPGSCGPVGLEMPIYADAGITHIQNMVVGANVDGFHYRNVFLGRDFKVEKITDLRLAKEGDPSPDGHGKLKSYRGIEVGHVFYLGTKYSEKMKAVYLDSQGKEKTVEMGCYGIGVSRTVQAIIEQSHDAGGIIWPKAIAPFDVHVCLLDVNDPKALEISQAIETELAKHDFEVLIDNREERPGVKFMDADLIGLPLRVNIGAKGIASGELEIIERKGKVQHKVKVDKVVEKLLEMLK